MESTVFKKMHLEEGAKGIALYAPPEFHAMAAGQELVAFPSRGPYDFVVLFATNLDEYRARVAEAREALSRRGELWVAFPKPRGRPGTHIRVACALADRPPRGAGGADRPRPRRLLGARLLQARDGEAVAAADTAAGRGASP